MSYELKTEKTYPHSKPIDKLDLNDAIDLMINEQKKSILTLQENKKKLNQIVHQICKKLKSSNDGRLIYTGAGTSGRIAVQDGIELYPTFGWPKKRLDFIMSGGKKALYRTIENAEDDIGIAKTMAKKMKFTDKDVLIAISASGNTPFTLEVLKIAKLSKALIVGICNNYNCSMIANLDNCIVLDTAEELVAGSTRLKAGTSQKACVNLISTLVMTKLGNVSNGLMVNMVPTNKKLINRKNKIKELIK